MAPDHILTKVLELELDEVTVQSIVNLFGHAWVRLFA
jgi:hypothetical protein